MITLIVYYHLSDNVGAQAMNSET